MPDTRLDGERRAFLATLDPVLGDISKALDPQAKYQAVKTWFETNPVGTISAIPQLEWLCIEDTLTDDERRLLTYPLIGNVFLQGMSLFKPTSLVQQQMQNQLTDLIGETRFNNPHMEAFYGDTDTYNKKRDALSTLMIAYPDDARPLVEAMKTIAIRIMDSVGQRSEIRRGRVLTTDFGHGLRSPAMHFEFLTHEVASFMEYDFTESRQLTFMVVDDTDAAGWYQRLAPGFKPMGEQKGHFEDCESALTALRTGLESGQTYDVILTDLDLGKGKMGGIEFVQGAYKLLIDSGQQPLIAVFSHDIGLLEEADRTLGLSHPPKIFLQATTCDKAHFLASEFWIEVSAYVRGHGY